MRPDVGFNSRESFISILVLLLISCVLLGKLSSFLKPRFSLQCDAENAMYLLWKWKVISSVNLLAQFRHTWQVAPDLQGFDLWLFHVTMAWKQYAFSRNPTLNLDLFLPRDMWYDTLSWCWTARMNLMKRLNQETDKSISNINICNKV